MGGLGRGRDDGSVQGGVPAAAPRESLPSLEQRYVQESALAFLPPRLSVVNMDLLGSMMHDYQCGNASQKECLLLTHFCFSILLLLFFVSNTEAFIHHVLFYF